MKLQPREDNLLKLELDWLSFGFCHFFVTTFKRSKRVLLVILWKEMAHTSHTFNLLEFGDVVPCTCIMELLITESPTLILFVSHMYHISDSGGRNVGIDGKEECITNVSQKTHNIWTDRMYHRMYHSKAYQRKLSMNCWCSL